MTRRLECHIQNAVIKKLRTEGEYQGVLFCATVGGVNCTVKERMKLIQSGYNKGIPDLMIYEPRGKYLGMAVEFKTPRGRVRDEQHEWHRALTLRGWYVRVHTDSDEALEDISQYLCLPSKNDDCFMFENEK